ncbi:MAG: 50S ribosomal protein L4 [Candidatus Diapherotrites archaeon]
MKANILSIEGKKMREIQLPDVFDTVVDAKLIKRAVLSIQSARLQATGHKPRAGRQNTAVYIGYRGKPQMHRTINVGRARLPRLRNRRFLLSGRVASVTQAVGGTNPHAPKSEKDPKERINKKEKKKAVLSAIAASTKIELVKERGHRIKDDAKLPFIFEKKIEELEKTKDVRDLLVNVDLLEDIERAKDKKKIRSGKGKKRGRKYKRAKSILIVVGDSSKIYKAARNLEGVDVVNVKNLNAELLAPGAKPGRLTIWSETAIEAL